MEYYKLYSQPVNTMSTFKRDIIIYKDGDKLSIIN